MAARVRITQIGAQSWLGLSKFRRISTISSFYSSSNRFEYRKISDLVKSNGNRGYLLDTLALVRSLEAQGIPSNHVESITSAITLVLDENLENISRNLISRVTQKIEMTEETNLSKFRRVSAFCAMKKVQSGWSSFYSTSSSNRYDKFNGNRVYLDTLERDRHFTLLRNEIEKLRLEMDKVVAELLAEDSKDTNKLRAEIHAFSAQLEAAKNDLLRFLIGTLISISVAVTGMRWMLSNNN